MDEIERRRTAVRLRQEGHTTASVAEQLGRSERWVRQWTARHEAAEQGTDWAQSHSRAPHTRPTETDQDVVDQVLAVRAKLEEDPRSQVGALAIAWELHLLGVDPVPQVWTINRILARAGVTKPRRRRPEGYRSKGAPYPTPPSGPGEFHQTDMVGPRHLDGGIRSDGRLDLWGHRVRIADEHTYQYVTAVIAVRAKTLTVVTRHGEIIHKGSFPIDSNLR